MPPIGCEVEAEVFDAYQWCRSDALMVRTPEVLTRMPLFSPDNPGDMGFVVRGPALFLPNEVAVLHFPDLCAEGEQLLAPYAIDDATDELYAHRLTPQTCMQLVSRSVRGLFWGLHDWAHFHNHGPFERISETELQCDLAALYWMKQNRALWNATDAELEDLRRAVIHHARERFGGTFPLALRRFDAYSA